MRISLLAEDAFRLAGTAPRSVLSAPAASLGSLDSVPRLMVRARLAQFDGDVTRGISLLCRALAVANDDERPYVVDMLAPLYVMRNDIESVCSLLSSTRPNPILEPPHTALRSVCAALRGDFDGASSLRREARNQICGSLDSLIVGVTLQRIGLSAYHCGDADEASAASLESAAGFREVRAFRAAAACYSVAYSVHHSMTGDVELAYEYAGMAVDAAKRFGDASYEIGSLVAQYGLAAEMADDKAVRRLKSALGKRPLPEQYRERFASAVAHLLQVSWSGDFPALRAAATILGDAPARSQPERTLCLAFRCLAETALSEDDLARRTSRLVLSRTDLRRKRDVPPHEQRYLRLARILAGSACVLFGDCVRGKKTLMVSQLRTSPEQALTRSVYEGRVWVTARRRIRGYARLLAAVRDQRNERGENPLTAQERDVLQMLADGKSAPQIARETSRSVYTIRAHTRSIIAKFSVHGRVAAISYARNAGYLT